MIGIYYLLMLGALLAFLYYLKILLTVLLSIYVIGIIPYFLLFHKIGIKKIIAFVPLMRIRYYFKAINVNIGLYFAIYPALILTLILPIITIPFFLILYGYVCYKTALSFNESKLVAVVLFLLWPIFLSYMSINKAYVYTSQEEKKDDYVNNPQPINDNQTDPFSPNPTNNNLDNNNSSETK